VSRPVFSNGLTRYRYPFSILAAACPRGRLEGIPIRPEIQWPAFFRNGQEHLRFIVPQTVPARFEGRSQNRCRPVSEPVSGNFQNGHQNYDLPILETGKRYSVSLSVRRFITRFGARFNNFLKRPPKRVATCFGNGHVLSRFIVRQTSHDPFWRSLR
jgi:hypothetical protein